MKAAARSSIKDAIGILAARAIVPIVRINALDAGAEDDILACVHQGLAGIVLPKTDGPQDVLRLDRLLADAERACGIPVGAVGIIGLPETAKGMWLAYEIAAASPRVTGLMTAVSGPVRGDVARAFGYHPSPGGEEQLFLQSRTILASRAAGANFPIGTIMGTRLDDLEHVKLLLQRARTLGFSGAALIHPSHVPLANEIFRPTPEEIEYADGLIKTMNEAGASGEGAIAYRGAMVDTAMIASARETLASAKRYAERDTA